MEQRGEPPESSIWGRLLLTVMGIAPIVIIAVGGYQFLKPVSANVLAITGSVIGGGFAIFVGAAVVILNRRAAAVESQARHRVRKAEDKLSDELRQPWVLHGDNAIPKELLDLHAHHAPVGIRDAERVDGHNGTRTTTVPVEDLAIERREDRLTLAALWDVTHGRMDLYHEIVTRQAKRSFGAAQIATAIGFVLLVVFAVLAGEAKTTAAAISAGGLGAVGAAFAAYIGKTFIRSQESAASHLRAYFDQPLELSRYLAAERLLADAKDLDPEKRAEIISTLVQSIATAGQGDMAKDGKPRATS